jgi:hypothetical protein
MVFSKCLEETKRVRDGGQRPTACFPQAIGAVLTNQSSRVRSFISIIRVVHGELVHFTSSTISLSFTTSGVSVENLFQRSAAPFNPRLRPIANS